MFEDLEGEHVSCSFFLSLDASVVFLTNREQGRSMKYSQIEDGQATQGLSPYRFDV